MPSYELIQNLLLLYAGAVLLNVALSAALYYRDRKPIYRALLVAWTGMLISLAAQAALAHGNLQIVLGFSTAFLVNFAFAHLLGSTTSTPPRWLPYSLTMAAGIAAAVAIHLSGGGFTATALPVAVAVALPCLVMVGRLIAARPALSTAKFILVAGCVLFSLHNLDFAFLRDKPEMAPLGFTIVTLVVFMLAIAGSAVALEQVTEQQVRLSTELDVARRIQARILPPDQKLLGLDVVCHLRSAESVGGDYLDICQEGERAWFLLGDVTGHGVGAGLVMLMAQSTMSSLLHACPDISPRQLNFLANRVLAGNLARMSERRHLTAIAMVREPGSWFRFSGSHDGLLVYRSGSEEVELRETNHFPVGLGFLGELGPDEFHEESLQLAPGDMLFLFTDGVTEAPRDGDPRAGLFGTDPIARLLRQHASEPLEQLKRAVVAEIDAFTGGVYHDDTAFLVIRVGEAAS